MKCKDAESWSLLAPHICESVSVRMYEIPIVGNTMENTTYKSGMTTYPK